MDVFVASIFKHRFIRASSIVLAGSFLVSISNYLFNLVMGRMLEPAEFGEVASLMGLLVITSVPAVTLVRLMAKYTASFKAKAKIGLISGLFRSATRYGLIVGLLMLIIFWLLIPFFSWFFKIDKLPFLFFGLILPFSLVLAVGQGTLQGLQRFIPFSLTNLIVSLVKLVLATIFVLLGFSVPGVVAALVVGYAVSYFYSLSQVKPHLKVRQTKLEEATKSGVDRRDIIPYVKVIFWASLLLVLFLNVDIILAKHYLSSDLAGQYAALSITGKIIVYGSGAFVTVMFPMVSEAQASGDGKEKKLLKMSFLIITAVSGLILVLFALFPELAIKMLFGTKYLLVAPYLGWFGLAMLFGTLAQVLIHYFLATQAKGFLYPFVFIVAAQILLIVLFHANIFQITMVMLVSSFLMLLAMSAVYFIQAPGVRKHEYYIT